MKTAAIALALLGTLSLAASPADAGRKKSKKKPAAAVEAPRRLSDELGLVAIARPTGAKKAARPARAEAALDTGASYDVGRLGRDTTMPTGDAVDGIRMTAQPLTSAQIATVVRGHKAELEYCWSKLPAGERAGAASLELRFSIEPNGSLAAFELAGADHDALAACVTAAASRWTFPVADTRTEAAYPITLAGK